MPRPVIKAENLSKRYLVGHRTERGGSHSYIAFRDVLTRELRNAARKTVDVVRGRQVVQGDSIEEFWALRNINFEVQEGEIVGIIGRNGAGKSTLLKILSRITRPTTGRVTLRGRAASLLEVGTGFHPELSGRENIYLNGAILGMNRYEIRKKFDEIVAFAEIERFLDTPVKRYSSGMYMRLAFAVAAHLEPEILIVDEVLAVGDTDFQNKCLGKMREVSRRDGRTVLFVSHNIAAVRSLCNRALLLQDSRIAMDGAVDLITEAYTTMSVEHNRRKSGEITKHLTETLNLDAFELAEQLISVGSSLGYEIRLSSTIPTSVREIAILIYSAGGVRVAIADLRRVDGSYRISSERQLRIKGRIQYIPFVEGEYRFGLWLNCGDFKSDIPDLATICVVSGIRLPTPTPYPARDRGIVELNYVIDEISDDQQGSTDCCHFSPETIVKD
jgi:lipopolysaccharide transport system ATP-binding protein